jgi:two-component system sensor histidine kinase/response regulator
MHSSIQENWTGASILVVEDDKFLQQVILDMLQSIGLKVHLASNGQEALNEVEKNSFIMIFMDMQMPVMDGITATRQIRQQPGYAQIPIVGLTGNTLKSDHLLCLKAGMNEVLIKPVSMTLLFECLGKWLSLK